MAAACVPMCQPSASSAIELNHQPAPISTTMVEAVSQTTTRVRNSTVCGASTGRVVDVTMAFLTGGDGESIDAAPG